MEFVTHPNANQEFDCSPNVKSTGFSELMHLVLNAKDPECLQKIKCLLAKDKSALHAKNDKGWTSLHLACRNSRTKSSLDIVKLLLEEGADINCVTRDNHTPLHMIAPNTAHDSHEELIDILVEKGAYIDAKANEGVTPLMFACLRWEASTAGTITRLIKNGACVNTYPACTPLYIACESSCETKDVLIKLLIENGANVNQSQFGRTTPLDKLISRMDSIELITYMIECGANSTNPDTDCIIKQRCESHKIKKDVECMKKEISQILDELKVMNGYLSMLLPSVTG